MTDAAEGKFLCENTHLKFFRAIFETMRESCGAPSKRTAVHQCGLRMTPAGSLVLEALLLLLLAALSTDTHSEARVAAGSALRRAQESPHLLQLRGDAAETTPTTASTVQTGTTTAPGAPPPRPSTPLVKTDPGAFGTIRGVFGAAEETGELNS